MQRYEMNQFMDSVTSQNITFNRDIEMKDLEGNVKIICKCYGTIAAGKSISVYMEVLEDTIFQNYRDTIQIEIDKYIQEFKQLATDYGVPIVL